MSERTCKKRRDGLEKKRETEIRDTVSMGERKKQKTESERNKKRNRTRTKKRKEKE